MMLSYYVVLVWVCGVPALLVAAVHAGGVRGVELRLLHGFVLDLVELADLGLRDTLSVL